MPTADTPLHRIRDDLKQQLAVFEDGTITTHGHDANGIAVDTTAETIERLRANIAQLERVIAGQPRNA